MYFMNRVFQFVQPGWSNTQTLLHDQVINLGQEGEKEAKILSKLFYEISTTFMP